MATRILFADDSVTAQNMGKRILTEAGYEVVAVSNGAAAVKKIAEQKPDIIILDLYMPGYSGLEVCEKVRGSMATLKTPVLLTVGKMEPPPRPEDANRVRADGVIVKPFEASDLLAIIKKFEERIVPLAPPLAEQAMAAEPEYATEPIVDLSPPHMVSTSAPQPMVEVPDYMASSSAFSDLLGTESPAPPPPPPPSAAAAYQAVDLPVADVSAPEYELPANWKPEEGSGTTEIELPAPPASGVEPPQHDVQILETGVAQPQTIHPEIGDIATQPAASRPLQIPVYQESAEAAPASGHELMHTAAAPIGEIEVPRDPYLEDTAAETTRKTIVTSTEPGLLSSVMPEQYAPIQREPAEMAPVNTSVTQAPQSSVDVPVDSQQEGAEATAEGHEAILDDADFEARVAAALANYNQNESSPEKPSADTAAPAAGPEHPAPRNAEFEIASSASASAVGSWPNVAAPVQPQPSVLRPATPPPSVSQFEYRPPVGARVTEQSPVEPPVSSPMSASVAIKPDVEPLPVPEPVHFEPVIAHEVAAHKMLDEAAHAGSGSQDQSSGEAPAARATIAQAVSRAMERLGPELVEEIMRELNSKEKE